MNDSIKRTPSSATFWFMLTPALAYARPPIHTAVAVWLALLTCGCQMWPAPIYPRLELPAGAARTRVLFVGNSLTYYNDLPGLLAQLSRNEPAPIEFDYETHPAWSLRRHWEWGSARKKIADGRWNYVVLQDFSTMPVDELEISIEYFRRFCELVTRSGGRAIVFENWPRKNRPNDAMTLAETYRTIQSQTGAAIAPVGQAWRRSRAAHPQIALMIDDRHPTPAGTYLAACVLYQAIYQKPATSLPTEIEGLRLDPPTATKLRETARLAFDPRSLDAPAMGH